MSKERMRRMREARLKAGLKLRQLWLTELEYEHIKVVLEEHRNESKRNGNAQGGKCD